MSSRSDIDCIPPITRVERIQAPFEIYLYDKIVDLIPELKLPNVTITTADSVSVTPTIFPFQNMHMQPYQAQVQQPRWTASQLPRLTQERYTPSQLNVQFTLPGFPSPQYATGQSSVAPYTKLPDKPDTNYPKYTAPEIEQPEYKTVTFPTITLGSRSELNAPKTLSYTFNNPAPSSVENIYNQISAKLREIESAETSVLTKQNPTTSEIDTVIAWCRLQIMHTGRALIDETELRNAIQDQLYLLMWKFNRQVEQVFNEMASRGYSFRVGVIDKMVYMLNDELLHNIRELYLTTYRSLVEDKLRIILGSSKAIVQMHEVKMKLYYLYYTALFQMWQANLSLLLATNDVLSALVDSMTQVLEIHYNIYERYARFYNEEVATKLKELTYADNINMYNEAQLDMFEADMKVAMAGVEVDAAKTDKFKSDAAQYAAYIQAGAEVLEALRNQAEAYGAAVESYVKYVQSCLQNFDAVEAANKAELSKLYVDRANLDIFKQFVNAASARYDGYASYISKQYEVYEQEVNKIQAAYDQQKSTIQQHLQAIETTLQSYQRYLSTLEPYAQSKLAQEEHKLKLASARQSVATLEQKYNAALNALLNGVTNANLAFESSRRAAYAKTQAAIAQIADSAVQFNLAASGAVIESAAARLSQDSAHILSESSSFSSICRKLKELATGTVSG